MPVWRTWQVCILESRCGRSARLTPPDAHAPQIVHCSVCHRNGVRVRCLGGPVWREGCKCVSEGTVACSCVACMLMCCLPIMVAGAAAGSTPEASWSEANKNGNAPEAESSRSLKDTHSAPSCEKNQVPAQSTLQTAEGHLRGAPQEQAPYSASFKEVVPADQSTTAMSTLCAFARVDSRCVA